MQLTFRVTMSVCGEDPNDNMEMVRLFRGYMEDNFVEDYGPDAWGGWEGPFVMEEPRVELVDHIDQKTRKAIVESDVDIDQVRRYMCGNYIAVEIQDKIVIVGYDIAGWTMDGYIIPRLASGMIVAKEVTDATV